MSVVPKLVVPPGVVARFLAREKRHCENGCIEWPVSEGGYAALQVRGHGAFYVHRVALFIKQGYLTKGRVTRHLCGNKLCCNPDHLLEGTQAENVADHRRALRGNT